MKKKKKDCILINTYSPDLPNRKPRDDIVPVGCPEEDADVERRTETSWIQCMDGCGENK